ncbi:MAG: hypothetical protein AAF755_05345 [Pseudomonadota bacterium]
MTDQALRSDMVVVIAGDASGIGLAMTKKFAHIGMPFVIVDRALLLHARHADLGDPKAC